MRPHITIPMIKRLGQRLSLNTLLKRIALSLSIFLLGTVTLIASPAWMFPLDSSIYEDLAGLFISQGLAQPSTAKPWSKDEVGFLLDKVNAAQLSGVERLLYNRIRLIVDKQDSVTSIGFESSLETYIHTNIDSFTTEDDWVYSYLQRKPLISLPVNLSLGPFYGHMHFPLGNRNFDELDDIVHGKSELYGTNAMTTNLPIQFWGSDKLYLDAGIPYRAFISAGGAGWLLQVGRERLSWGPGESGNFMIGDHLQYHNQARLAAYKNNFKYSFLTLFFPHPDEIWDFSLDSDQARPLIGLKMFMAHRFEWRILDNALGIALNEGIMYQHEDGILDLRILNPLMLFHNYFVRQHANSLASLEIDYALGKGFNIYGQVAVDELSFGSTELNLDDEDKHPNGRALMLGLKIAKPFKNGILHGHLEGAYTDPYLYLRSIEGDSSQALDADNLSYVVAIRRWMSDKVYYDQSFMGYQYGGDAIVLDGSLGFRVPGVWQVRGNLFAMLHGEVDMNTLWELGELDLAPTGSPTIFGQIGISASNQLGNWNVYGSFDYLLKMQNYKALHDVQFVIGTTYSYR